MTAHNRLLCSYDNGLYLPGLKCLHSYGKGLRNVHQAADSGLISTSEQTAPGLQRCQRGMIRALT